MNLANRVPAGKCDDGGDEREYQCACHITGEVQRVIFGARALREDDFEQFGQYMFQSHESSRDYLKNSTKQLDILVELARKAPGILGARLTGGGFGGCTVTMLRPDALPRFRREIAKSYEEKFDVTPAIYPCEPSAGASEVR